MGRATSHCMQCGNPKDSGSFLDDYCQECFAAAEGAKADAIANGKDPVAARRAALAARAHNAHRNFVDPRAIDRRTIWMSGAPSNHAPVNDVSGLPFSGR